jgi:cytochrome c oxidase assembly factor CtaG
MIAWSFDPGVVVFLLVLGCFYAVGYTIVTPSDSEASALPLGEGEGEGRTPDRRPIFHGTPRGFATLTPTLSQRERRLRAPNALEWRRIFGASTGIIVLAIALISPLDALGDRGVFVAHMAQHLLLLLVVPVFLVAGLPDSAADALRLSVAPRVGNLAAYLPASLLLSVGAVWVWHAPRLFQLALSDPTIHLLEHTTFVSTALLFWWPVVRPDDFRQRVPELALLIYLFAAAVACSMLGALITFAGKPVYSSAAAAAFGLAPIQDQQLGGILMWGFGGLWYFGIAGVVFARWFAGSAAREECVDG